MAEAIETMAARLGQLQARLEQQTNALQAAQQTAQAQQQVINQLQSESGRVSVLIERTASVNEKLVESIDRLGERSSGAVDSKGVGKPFTFASDEAKFHAWQKKVRNYVSAALPGAREFMEWAGDHSRPISRVELEDKWPEKQRLLAQVEENLYTCLSSFTDGEAWSIASNTPEGQGLEAYRRLCFRFDPTTAGRRRNIVSSLLNPEKVKLDDLGTAIET